MLLVDLDPQSNATRGSGVEGSFIDNSINDVLLNRASLDKLKADMERDKFMNADEAVAYGLVDKVITTRDDDNKSE